MELLVTIVVLGVLAAVVVFAVRDTKSTAVSAACVADAEALDRAESTNDAIHSRYATEAELVSNGYLTAESELHDVTLQSSGYSVVPRGDCFGVPGGAGATTTSGSGQEPTTTIASQPMFAAMSVPSLPSGIVAGSVISPAVSVSLLDEQGAVQQVDGVAITVSLSTNPTGAVLGGATTVSTVGGTAMFSDLRLDKSASGYVLEASSMVAPSSSSTPFAIGAAPPATLEFTQQPDAGITTTAWTSQPVVTLRDSFGNVANSGAASVTLSVSPGSGTPGASLSCASTTVAATAGLASFGGCKIATIGTGYRLVAASTAMASVTSAPFSVSGAPTKLVITQQPTNALAGATIAPSFTVRVTDSANNVVTASSATISLTISTNPAAGVLAGTVTQTADAGIATFDGLSINRVGTGYRLTAASPGLTAAVSSTFNITAGTPSKLTFKVEPSGAKAGVNWTKQPAVSITDVLGNTVTSSTAAVTLAITEGTGVAGAALTCTANPKAAVAGVTTFAGCKINLPGSDYSITASSPGIPDVVSAPFDNPVGPATKVQLGQQPLSSAAGAAFGSTVTVSVRDAVGNVVKTSTATISLSISTNPGGGSLSGTTSVVVVDGLASFPGLSINKSGTGYKLTATSTGLTSVASSTFNITAAAATAVEFRAQPGGGAANAAWSAQPTTAIVDAYGNTVTTSTAAVTLSVKPATGTPGAVLTCTSNPKASVAGLATFAGCKINSAGTGYVLNATATGLTGGQSQSFAIS